jgi:tripartite-type tricarboxylate transporter receptor subunit TctC
MRRRFLLLGLAAALVAPTLPAHAQGDQIRIIFPFAAGGSGDTLARMLAEKLRTGLNRTVVVENRTGGAGQIGVVAVKNAAPDGNTLLLTPIAPMSIYQHVYKALQYDPVNDFTPVAQIGTFDFGIAVGRDHPAKTLKNFVAWAKANPAQGNFGVPAAGTLPHFLGVMLGRAAQIDLRQVPYRGSAAALTDLMGGQIPIVVTTTSDLTQFHKDGRIRVLATSDKARSPFLPDVPTFRESGYDLVASGWYGVFAPAKTPADVVARINKVIVDAVRAPDFRDKLLGFGLAPTGTSATQFAAIQKADAEFWGPAVKASGFKAD